MSKIKIMVAAHKKFPMPDDRELYMPVLVGATKNYHEGIDYQRDDIGENISNQNPNYNELTAIYWAWKNLKNVDAVGLVHYRRYFVSNKRTTIDKKSVESILKNHDMVLPKRRKYYIETNYSHYIHAHNKEPLETTKKIISDFFPDYVDSFNIVMKRRSAHMFNMFIIRKPLFDEYCDWLFSILEKVDRSIDISKYSKQEARVFGYLSELLMDVWVRKNKVNYCECDWVQIGGERTLIKALYLVLRKLKISRKTHFD